MLKKTVLIVKIFLMLVLLTGILYLIEILIPEDKHYLSVIMNIAIVLLAITVHITVFYKRSCKYINKLVATLVENISSLPGIKINNFIEDKPVTLRSHYDKLEKILSDYNSQLIRKYYYLDNNSLLMEVIVSLNNLMYEIENTEKLFTVILEKAIQSIPKADSGSILSLKDDDLLTFEAAVGFDMDELSRTSMSLHDCYLWKESNGNPSKPYIISHKFQYDKIQKNKENFKIFNKIGNFEYKSTITSPIIIEGKLFGIINFDSYEENAFNQDDIVLIEYFSSQVGAVIKNHNQIEKAIYRARYDSLTGIHNREFFEEVVSISIKQGLRQKTGFILTMLDLNDFKIVNDTQGHQTGDKILKYFTEVFDSYKRDSDLFARWGGDEFVAAFYNSSEDDIADHMEKILNHFQNNPFSEGDYKYIVSFSYGTAVFPDQSTDLKKLIEIADIDMYENKKRTKTQS